MGKTAENTLWAATAPPGPTTTALDGELTADVVIIGAGFTGLRAALELSTAGADVAVVDAGEIGAGASGRSGGQVNPALPFVSPDELHRRVGPVYSDRLIDAATRSADTVFDVIRRHNIPCDARQHGWVRADHCARQADMSRQHAEAWRRRGAEMEIIGGNELRQLTGTSTYNSGIYTARGGAVQPLAFARGLARAAQTHGANLFCRTPITQLTRNGGRWTVSARQGEIQCDCVILATNAYSGAYPGAVRTRLAKTVLPLVPIQVATEPLDPAVIEDILPSGATISDTRRVIMYARREPDNRIVFGSLGYQRWDGSIAGHDWLIRDARRVFPQLRKAAWPY